MAANPVTPRSSLTLDTHIEDGTTVVICHGRLTAEATTSFKDQVKALIPRTKRLVLDLSDVSYMDSSGLGALVGIYVSAKHAGCQLKLVNLNERIMELLRITKVATIFDEYGGYL